MRDLFIQTLENNALVLEDFVSKMSMEEINKRIKDFWTINQHVEHLVTTQKVILTRLNQFINEEFPTIKPYTPDNEINDKPREISSLINEFKEIRKQQINLIKNAESHVWDKAGKHPQYKKYSFEILVRHAIVHDGFHMWRMEELWIENEDLIMEFNSN